MLLYILIGILLHQRCKIVKSLGVQYYVPVPTIAQNTKLDRSHTSRVTAISSTLLKSMLSHDRDHPQPTIDKPVLDRNKV